MQVPDARVIVFTRARRFAPDFHRHILRGKIVGQTVRPGDRVLVYEVAETVPEGAVRVTRSTRFEFR
ncbi:hypothetical protein [Methanoculleus sp. UBA303]|uniref:hypothetical protein n=1 Tax=Methanoculleus sp. UBA303 TaxID=1915497 RepID=UPI0025E33D0B|nr:hypothetical protein [Methanoculleus sp. UBA303]MDD3932684.1 hypothetical protein [Methanoculleus sp.]